MEHILSLSYGKDSLSCLFAVEKLGWPLDRIIHAEVWATDDIPADPPPMVEFKIKADRYIRERWGIEVEHLCATRNGEKLTYEKLFYHVPVRKSKNEALRGHRLPVPTEAVAQRAFQSSGSKEGFVLGFPMLRGQWCTSDLKRRVFFQLPCTRSEDKYCAVPRYCG